MKNGQRVYLAGTQNKNLDDKEGVIVGYSGGFKSNGLPFSYIIELDEPVVIDERFGESKSITMQTMFVYSIHNK